jgi:imidazole glycerol-phosphate synthase subunit HisF
MKNIRIIAKLDIKGPRTVKGVHTEGLKIVGNPKDLAMRYYESRADEIIYNDIVASLYQRNLDFDQLKDVSDGIFIPFTVGGGIRSINDINNALRAGADKVAINTYAIAHPEFLSEAIEKFGSQCVVISVEAKKRSDGTWEAYTDGGREPTGVDAVEWIKKATGLGVGEILITSIDYDGTYQGFDMDLIKAVTDFARVPVIVHGGAADPQTVLKAITEAKADAISASSIFHFDKIKIPELKKQLAKDNIKVRL